MKSGLVALGTALGVVLALGVAACSPGQSPAPYGQTGTPAPSSPQPSYRQAHELPIVVAKPANPCATNHKAKWVLVRLSKQHMWLCEKTKVVRDSAITSGMSGEATETPTGRYEIQGRNRDTTLTLNTGKTYAVKYWIPFDAPLFGFHDSSWQKFDYGSSKYKTDGSHGCVHLPLKTIRFLYDWADVGTAVRIKA